MSLRELLNNNSIEAVSINNTDIRNKIVIAERDIRAAKKIIAINDPDIDDTAYNTAYNAILQAGYALMFSKGYRVKARSRAHLVVQQFVESEFANDFDEDILLVFGDARQTRNTLLYDTTGVISHPDVEALVNKAEIFVTEAKKILNIP